MGTLFLLCFLSAFAAGLTTGLAAGQATGHQETTDLRSTPAYLIVTKYDGEIWRCDYYNPTRCEVFHKVSRRSFIHFTLVHGEYLYAALESGQLLRCEWYKSFCSIFHPTDKYDIMALAVAGGYLYAGLSNALLLRCQLNLLQNCAELTTLRDSDLNEPIRSIFVFGKYIYVATLRSLFKCIYGEEGFACSPAQTEENNELDFMLMRVTHLGNTFIKISSHENGIRYYNLTSRGSMINTKIVFMNGLTYDGVVFKRRIHVLLRAIYNKIDVRSITKLIKVSDEKSKNFIDFVRHEGAMSISFAYGVRYMQTAFDGVSCVGGEGGRLPVAAFRAEQRWMVEVSVVEGRLVDSRGQAVDTRAAGVGYSGRAAVFAMGPDGQILLINEHRSGLAHLPSLFAGGPVAGAGEIQVEHGIVKRIVACSVHYWPDVSLNRQVVDELYQKGYTKADDIVLEECNYKCDKDKSDEHYEL